ncbi:hypothetical protein HPB52_018409 [Rhipicephalus sanguineus]|uniref:C2 domain-containing protein n=1 Tax=Rhipicephalus sanguineus TaxID=34632 RepID=A0A9D4Q7H8_RHISA|nr:hypothetical protein HPB52_018409 [Rhipicephalus sanguineus]
MENDLSRGRDLRLRLCALCLYLSDNVVGKPTRPHHANPEQLRGYVRRLFADVFEYGGEEAVQERVAALVPPTLQLAVRVVQADGLREPCDTYVGAKLQPGGTAVQTSVRCNSATPRWDEELVMTTQGEWRRARLSVELWRRRGCWRPRLLGSTTQPLAELPCVAVDRWEPLGVAGRLQLRLEMRGVPESEDDARNDHLALTRLFLADAVSHSDDPLQWLRWEDCLRTEPLTLLRQHALQWGVTSADEAGCRLLAAAMVRDSHGRLSYRVLQSLLQGTPAPESAVSAVATQTRALLGRLHDDFSLRDGRQALDLFGVLSCCSLCEAQYQRPVSAAAREEVRDSARRWHLQLASLGVRDVADLGRLLLLLGQYHGAADPVFSRAWKQSYTEITVRELDALLDAHVRPRVVALCAPALSAKGAERERLVLRSLEVFRLLRTFVGAVSLSFRPSGCRSPWTPWCRALVPRPPAWPTAIEERLVGLWTSLDWPHPEIARRFALLVSECAILFAQSTERRARRQRFYGSAIGGVSTRMCVALSNVHVLVASLAHTQRNILRCFNTRPECDDALADVCAPVQRAAETLATCALRLGDALLVRIQPELDRLLVAAVSCAAPEAQERALIALAAHLDTSLVSLRAHLEPTAFHNAMQHLWRGLVSRASRLERARWRKAERAPALLDALRRLRKIMQSAGLTAHQLDCEPYRDLERRLLSAATS